jgi:hypothetical protein
MGVINNTNVEALSTGRMRTRVTNSPLVSWRSLRLLVFLPSPSLSYFVLFYILAMLISVIQYSLFIHNRILTISTQNDIQFSISFILKHIYLYALYILYIVPVYFDISPEAVVLVLHPAHNYSAI